jgi:hypothetical protein
MRAGGWMVAAIPLEKHALAPKLAPKVKQPPTGPGAPLTFKRRGGARRRPEACPVPASGALRET